MSTRDLFHTHPEEFYWNAYWERASFAESIGETMFCHFRLRGHSLSAMGIVAVSFALDDGTMILNVLDPASKLKPTEQCMIGRMPRNTRIWNPEPGINLRLQINETSYAAYNGVFLSLVANRHRPPIE